MRRARAEARRSRLVSWPSFSKAASGRPGAQEARPFPETSMAMTFSAGDEADHDEATPETEDSDDEPRSPSTVREDEPQPDEVSSAGHRSRRRGVRRQHQDPTTRCSTRARRSRDRPTDDESRPRRTRKTTPSEPEPAPPTTPPAPPAPEPRGPAASSRSPTPADPPTPARRPSGRRTQPGAQAEKAPAATATAPASDRHGGTRERCREPPHSTDASSTSDCDDGESEAQPSAPIPTTTISVGTPVDVMAADAIVTRTRREVPHSGRIWEAGENPAQGPLR